MKFTIIHIRPRNSDPIDHGGLRIGWSLRVETTKVHEYSGRFTFKDRLVKPVLTIVVGVIMRHPHYKIVWRGPRSKSYNPWSIVCKKLMNPGAAALGDNFLGDSSLWSVLMKSLFYKAGSLL